MPTVLYGDVTKSFHVIPDVKLRVISENEFVPVYTLLTIVKLGSVARLLNLTFLSSTMALKFGVLYSSPFL
jgi:hypothetical protein